MDKVQKIREEVERLKVWNNNVRNSTRHMTLQEEDFNRGKHSSYLEILNFIDSLQEEPVKIKKGCKYRCLSDMVNKDTGNIAFIGDKIYLAPKDNTLTSEENGWLCDTSENASNFELVEESVSKDLEKAVKEVTKDKESAVIFLKDAGIMDENGNLAEPYRSEEPVSEDLEDAAMQYAKLKHTDAALQKIVSWDFKAGAQWQKEKDDELLTAAYMNGVEKGKKAMKKQLMKDAVSGVVELDLQIKLANGSYIDLDPSMQLKPAFQVEAGDKVKTLIIKEE